MNSINLFQKRGNATTAMPPQRGLRKFYLGQLDIGFISIERTIEPLDICYIYQCDPHPYQIQKDTVIETDPILKPLLVVCMICRENRSDQIIFEKFSKLKKVYMV